MTLLQLIITGEALKKISISYNYGVVKKCLMLENDKFVPKAVKFTCVNNSYEASKEENIKKELIAGKICNLIGYDNLAYVEKYGTMDKFIKRLVNDQGNQLKEMSNASLKDILKQCFLKEDYTCFPDDKKNIKKDFKNNVFSEDNNTGDKLYYMVMKYLNGKDLFEGKVDNIDKENLDKLGDMLFTLLTKCYIYNVAIRDLKPKNIVKEDNENNFFVIDLQSFEKGGKDLTDCFGTPEYWPFVKILEIRNENNKEENKEENQKDLKKYLHDTYVISNGSNFVDMYSACMTMYFYKFHRPTAAGLLILLLKYLVLNKNDGGVNYDNQKFINIDSVIDYLKNYETKYSEYINNKLNDALISEQDSYFFKEIDDRNLNNEQKEDLKKLLKEIITYINSKKDNNVKFDIYENGLNGIENFGIINDDDDKGKIF